MKHPIQPVEVDSRGVKRFKENKVVRWLLDNGGKDLNDIARQGFDREEQEQFAQLIGYSLSGASDLGYMSDAVLQAAEAYADGDEESLKEKEAYSQGYADGREAAFERIAEVVAESKESYV